MRFRIILLSLFVSTFSFAQSNLERIIEWMPNKIFEGKNILCFQSCNYNDKEYLPSYYEKIAINSDSASVELINTNFIAMSNEEKQGVAGLNNIQNNLKFRYEIAYENKKPYVLIYLTPLSKNLSTGQLQKLISFSIKITPVAKNITEQTKTSNLHLKSTKTGLFAGTNQKIQISHDGIYKITYKDLQNRGFRNFNKINIYGTGGAMLPEDNSKFDEHLLKEIPMIKVDANNNGNFDEGDYFLCYLETAVKWEYSQTNQMFIHKINLYSNSSYYFIVEGESDTKEVKKIESETAIPTNIVNSFDDRVFYENELQVSPYSFRQWIGETFDSKTHYDIAHYPFPNIDTNDSENIKLRTNVCSAGNLSKFLFKINEKVIESEVHTSNGTMTTESDITSYKSSIPSINISIDYQKNSPSDVGYLDNFTINARRKLIFQANYLTFRDANSYGAGKIAKFKLANTTANTTILDISDLHNIQKINKLEQKQDTSIFALKTDVIREFGAFDGNNFPAPTFLGEVANKDLHSIKDVDLLIITHSLFMDAAKEIAEFHKNEDNLTVAVVDIDDVYNEFSSGALDPTAIRFFAKNIYDNSTTKRLRYLFLMGDGSYDYKNNSKSANNSNFIPVYEQFSSYSVSDDYYTFLDNNEIGISLLMDIGVGRLPVNSSEQAASCVNKIKTYYSKQTMRNWRNIITILADDQDDRFNNSTAFTVDAEEVSSNLSLRNPEFNMEKLYADAFMQYTTSGGQRYPDINDFIKNKTIAEGALIFNYLGHGGYNGVADERLITTNDINSWTNILNMPIFFTGTCSLGGYDDFRIVSAGEHLVLNPSGAAIAAFTTTRETNGPTNKNLNKEFYNYVFDDNTAYNEKNRIGDVFKSAKNSSSFSGKIDFTLLGDPALRIAIPQENITTDSIYVNGKKITDTDTVKALQKMRIFGHIENKKTNSIIADFKGNLQTTIYDKMQKEKTLGNDGFAILDYKTQQSIIYKGSTAVDNGKFNFEFIVPKDIQFNTNLGKISYYAENQKIDANGYHKFKLGDTDINAPKDTIGPVIKLYMNNENFGYGGITDANPYLIAYITDESGVNTVGNGIGHDITAIVNENTGKTIILNDYYTSDAGTYQKGQLKYQLANLADGNYKIKVKVWDVYNNSSEQEIEFIVSSNKSLAIDHILNYPNPFSTRTAFYFDHNQAYRELDVSLQIFTISGKIVKSINTSFLAEGFRSPAINWDGLDEYGDKIAKGVYIYKIKVQNKDGQKVEKFQKLLLIN